VRYRQRQGRLLHRPGPGRHRLPAKLEREGKLGAHRRRYNLGLRILRDVADDPSELTRSTPSDIEPPDLKVAPRLPAVKVRDEAAGSAQQGRLSRRRPPGEYDELAGADFQRHVPQGIRAGTGVAI
jgi:hypothetical protein